jgi:hypothetical protein
MKEPKIAHQCGKLKLKKEVHFVTAIKAAEKLFPISVGKVFDSILCFFHIERHPSKIVRKEKLKKVLI